MGRAKNKVRPHPVPMASQARHKMDAPMRRSLRDLWSPRRGNLIAQLTAVLGRSSRDCMRKLLVGNGATFGVFGFCPILSGMLYTEPTETATRMKRVK